MANADRPLRFSESIWSKPSHLREWRERLGVGQVELAQAAGVAQTTISALERGAEPFTEPSRTKIWNAIARLNAEFLQRQAIIHQAVAPDTSDPVSLLYLDPKGEGYFYAASANHTPMELLRAERKHLQARIAILERDLGIAHDYIKKVDEEKKELLGMLGWRVKKTVEDSEQVEAEQGLMDKLGAEKLRQFEAEELRAEIARRGKKGK
jgi:transcriptional regulator with XRE-family HTH domain